MHTTTTTVENLLKDADAAAKRFAEVGIIPLLGVFEERRASPWGWVDGCLRAVFMVYQEKGMPTEKKRFVRVSIKEQRAPLYGFEIQAALVGNTSRTARVVLDRQQIQDGVAGVLIGMFDYWS